MSEPLSESRAARQRSPYVLDGLIALALSAICVTAFFTSERAADQRDADALGVALVVVATAPFVFRRRWPLVVFVLATGATVAVFLRDYPDSGLPFVVAVALYTLAARCDRRITVVATAGLLLAIVLVIAPASDMDPGTLAGTLGVFALAAAWGDRRKVRDAYAEQLALRAAEKERERLEAARRAASEERLRIARELHDVVAHAMSVIAVQSGAGVHIVESRPDEGRRILETISDTSRATLDEMRRLLGVLRADPASTDTATELAPAPGLGRLDELVGRVTEAGLPVEATVEGERAGIPLGVDLAAYRIVQEALTNVLKHGGRARASVTVRYEPGAVHLEVVDDGRGAASTGVTDNGSGHGLVGMRERAALYGAELDAGPRPGGGYRVATTLRYTAP